MASSSSSSLSRNWRYNVFTSFHGPDVRKTFLSHLRKQFSHNGISMFDDQGIERSQVIAPALTQGIRDSKISILLLSKNYASSSWCLDELVEILKCKEDIGQIVMTVFYGVDPSDVRKQTGEFGRVFNKTWSRKTEEERQRWSEALFDAGNIAGEHFLNWNNEAEMIEKIAKDVLDKLNATPCRDFDGMVGLDAHLKEMESLLDLDDDGVKVVAICGPAGIGKTTIARALRSRLSDRFQLTCIMDDLRGSYRRGFDEYGLKLRLQEEFLSKVLNHNGLSICHLGAVKENLCNQKVLIILDDVNNLNQLEALANETTWFGPGSRIVVTTENQELLQQHGIVDTYHVRYPSTDEAREILCGYDFKQSSPRCGFQKFFGRITELCGNLPLALRVVGSSLCGKKEDEWEDVVNRLGSILHRDIEDVLRVGYESLHENEQTLFLHIAIFFNGRYADHVKAMFADDKLDVKSGLKILLYRSLIYTDGQRIMMHKLLQQMARQVNRNQKPSKRQILMDADEICDVLENETGTRAVLGILFDISGISEVFISKRALKRMSNLRFLKVYKSISNGENDITHMPAEMEFPRLLRLLDWRGYPSNCLPRTFHAECLVELLMRESQLEYLWQGTQKLTNLKKMNLSWSIHLKELPDLSKATNLEKLELIGCKSLEEIPSSFSHLQKLQKLWMRECTNLQVIPPQLNLASLESIDMRGCRKLRNISEMLIFLSTKFRNVDISETEIEDVPALIRLWPRLKFLDIMKIGNLKGFLTYLPTTLAMLNLCKSDIERIPDCIKDLHQLQWLFLIGCKRLASLPELPRSLRFLHANDCESLETVFCPLNRSRLSKVNFGNCFKLDQQSRRAIVKHSISQGRETIIPGREMPAKFEQRAKGNILTMTISLDGNIPLPSLSQLQVCLVLSPNHQNSKCSQFFHEFACYRIGKRESELNGRLDFIEVVSLYRGRHLLMFDCDLQSIDPSEVNKEKIVLKFSCGRNFKECGCLDIIECGAFLKTKETIEENYFFEVDQVSEEDEPNEAFEDHTQLSLMEAMNSDSDRTDGVICEPKEEEHTHCWSWLFHCFHLSDYFRNIGN